MCALFPIQIIERAINVFRCVSLLVCQDKIDQLGWDIIISWNNSLDFILIISVSSSEDGVWGHELVVGQ